MLRGNLPAWDRVEQTKNPRYNPRLLVCVSLFLLFLVSGKLDYIATASFAEDVLTRALFVSYVVHIIERQLPTS